MHMKLRAPNSVTVRLAEGQPVIPDISAASVPERFRGRPKLDSSRCTEGCSACVDVCPTHAVSLNPLTIDLGACVFCPLCSEACPEGAISYTNDYKIAATSRAGLLLRVKGAKFRRKAAHRKFSGFSGVRSSCAPCRLAVVTAVSPN
jgi:formate hydrogenlyase subunit 6/NADH:ubiquinone oxidoreductase subunit I